MKDKDMNAPGEIRNPLQIVVRLVVVLLIIAVVGGFLWALFLRPERVIEESLLVPPALHALAGGIQVGG